MIWPSFLWVSGGQPASVASFGNQEMSPHLKTVSGGLFASALDVSSFSLGHGDHWCSSLSGTDGVAGAPTADMGASALAGMFIPRKNRVKDKPQPINVFKYVSPECREYELAIG
jgi:hypothetical protein